MSSSLIKKNNFFSFYFLIQFGNVDANQYVIQTVAGTGTAGSGGNGGQATSATLNGLDRIAAGSDETLYIAEYNGIQGRKVSPTGITSLFYTPASRGIYTPNVMTIT